MTECSVEGCTKPTVGRHLCRLHYDRWWRYGRTDLVRAAKGAPLTFLQGLLVTEKVDTCVIWPFACDPNGYARIKAKDGETDVAARRMCEMKWGPPPTPEAQAAHSCGKGDMGCVNPWHLRWGSRTQNSADSLEHGTRVRGERVGGAVLTELDVRQIRALRGLELRAHTAKRFGVSRTTVFQVQERRTWGWLD